MIEEPWGRNTAFFLLTVNWVLFAFRSDQRTNYGGYY